MMEKQNSSKSKNLRQKLLAMYHDDGILDLVAGASVLMLAGVIAFDSVVFIGLIGIPIILYFPIKEQVSIPRMGLIRFEAEDVTRNRMVFFVLLGLVAFLVVALLRSGVSSGLEELFWENLVLVFALFLAGSLFAAGRILNNPRFVVYALISLVLVLGASFAGLRVWAPVFLVGLLMEAAGVYKLVTFLQAYPLESGV
jgi:hypothetical protein